VLLGCTVFAVFLLGLQLGWWPSYAVSNRLFLCICCCCCSYCCSFMQVAAAAVLLYCYWLQKGVF